MPPGWHGKADKSPGRRCCPSRSSPFCAPVSARNPRAASMLETAGSTWATRCCRA